MSSSPSATRDLAACVGEARRIRGAEARRIRGAEAPPGIVVVGGVFGVPMRVWPGVGAMRYCAAGPARLVAAALDGAELVAFLAAAEDVAANAGALASMTNTRPWRLKTTIAAIMDAHNPRYLFCCSDAEAAHIAVYPLTRARAAELASRLDEQMAAAAAADAAATAAARVNTAPDDDADDDDAAQHCCALV